MLKVFHDCIIKSKKHDDPHPPVLSIDGTRNVTEVKQQSAIVLTSQNHDRKNYIAGVGIAHSESANSVFKTLLTIWLRSQDL
jgi:hypothetical protein